MTCHLKFLVELPYPVAFNIFLQLLFNAGFEELSARDLRLTSALNTDYLLTLPISVDWKSASQSSAILFRKVVLEVSEPDVRSLFMIYWRKG
ncbi:uncharacterized protein [Solanum lycopersicum]|uniref:uncharacterized protein n=1 Tax=Solanum lycopersicum TaxID=4081 RepID=UPI000532D90A